MRKQPNLDKTELKQPQAFMGLDPDTSRALAEWLHSNWWCSRRFDVGGSGPNWHITVWPNGHKTPKSITPAIIKLGKVLYRRKYKKEPMFMHWYSIDPIIQLGLFKLEPFSTREIRNGIQFEKPHKRYKKFSLS